MKTSYDVIIIGAGAAGMMCAIEAGKRGRRVLLLDHRSTIGEKIRISGGGRCNFTNIHTRPEHFLSQNPHFCKSALSRYKPADFVALVTKHGIGFHEKTLGQLFCDHSAMDIITMLRDECDSAHVHTAFGQTVNRITQESGRYHIHASNQGSDQCYDSDALIVATGGLSIPKIGATGLGYSIAKQWNIDIIETQPALVPFTSLEPWRELSGLALPVRVSCAKQSFDEAMLFTHRGLSGPAILQISSYWNEGKTIAVNLLPHLDIESLLIKERNQTPTTRLVSFMSQHMPKRLAKMLCIQQGYETTRICDLSNAQIAQWSNHIHQWNIQPDGTEGYRTAEVTRGGVNTRALSSKTMEATQQPGLYFIGEVMDVTGHLGGFNFQWAWSSGYAAGQVC